MGDSLPTIDLGTGRTAKTLVAGSNHACVLLDNNQVKCWGYNVYGELGLGDTSARGDQAGEMGDSLLAVSLGTSRAAKAAALGDSHTCVVLDTNQIKCWGHNAYGDLGLGDTDSRGDGPGEMGDYLPAVSLGAERSVTLAASGNCALLNTNQVKCWGETATGSSASAITTGEATTPVKWATAFR